MDTSSSKGDRMGMSPYTTGGGGVTFERKVAVKFLANLLIGNGTFEIGDGRHVLSVKFQQAPEHAVDDLVVDAAYLDEGTESFLALALAVRRKPNIIQSDESARKLIGTFVRDMVNVPRDGAERRFGLVVAGQQDHAEQLAMLASHAAGQMDASGFFKLIRSPNKFPEEIRRRLKHMEELVKLSLGDLGITGDSTEEIQQRTWQLLKSLVVSMPRLESPDETDWSAITNSLIPVARDTSQEGALRLRDRLLNLASGYAPRAARVDLSILRRDTHALLELTTRRNKRGWRALDLLNREAIETVNDKIVSGDGSRCIYLDRNEAVEQLIAMLADTSAVVVVGESGVGKSALAVRGLTTAAEEKPDEMQALCINLRHVPRLPVDLEDRFGVGLSILLNELSAPQRTFVIDGADAAAEDMKGVFRYLVDAAKKSDVKIVVVTAIDGREVVRDILKDNFFGDNHVKEHTVPPLTDQEIGLVVETFTELERLSNNPKSHELLRRLVVIDLLVRSDIQGVPLSDADAMHEVWSRLVRRREMSDRGTSGARELVLLKLAGLKLCDIGSNERLDVINGLAPAALDGLRHDGLLRRSHDDPFMIGPEFAHDEIRRYAVARLLLSDRAPAEKIMEVDAPRWSLSAAQLACQALLAEPDKSTNPLLDRLSRLQSSFDSLVKAGYGARWGDVPGEALVAIGDPNPVLRDAWSDLRDNDAAGLKRLTRLVDQRLRGKNGIVDIHAVEPFVELLLEDNKPWKSGEYVQELLRDWLHGHLNANTAKGHPLRIRLRERLVDTCTAADLRLVKEQKDRDAELAARTPEEVERDNKIKEEQRRLPFWGKGNSHPEIPSEITSPIVLELFALLGPDLGSQGEEILQRVVRDAPWHLAPAVEKLFTGHALAGYGKGLLTQLTQAYYLDDEKNGYELFDDGIRCHDSRSVRSPLLSAWYRGPFIPLFRNDFREGVKVLNRLLNHATRLRVAKLARLYQIELEITGECQLYLGDDHVWYWYRGSGVGPFPCFSALQALERVCDELIKLEIPIRRIVSILLDGCESLAMVGLIVGLLVRHAEKADRLLDPYLTEPCIWDLEFARVTGEYSGLAANSEGLEALDRRTWSFHEVAMFMISKADQKRVGELQGLGKKLVLNEHRRLESKLKAISPNARKNFNKHVEQRLMLVRRWASHLDRSMYQAEPTSDGLQISVIPPKDVTEALQENTRDLDRGKLVMDLRTRYLIKPRQVHTEHLKTDELEADISVARELLENPPSLSALRPWDEPVMVAAAALEAHFLHGIHLSEGALSFAANIIIRVGFGEAGTSSHEDEMVYFEAGADRSAARAIPLLFLSEAAPLRAAVDKSRGWTNKQHNVAGRIGRMLRGIVGKELKLSASECTIEAGIKLAQTISYEVRLHLARGMDHIWCTPCAKKGRCHHDVGWRLIKETMRDCVFGDFDVKSHRRPVIKIKKPFVKSLSKYSGESIIISRLDAAIRALAPAAVANIRVSGRARLLLSALFDAQRRALLLHGYYEADHRGSHTLVSARALLTLAEHGDKGLLFEYIEAYANRPDLLSALLRALSAAAEETRSRAATARRIWPDVVGHILVLENAEHALFQDKIYGDRVLACLLPNSAHESEYLYREIQDQPIVWWDPILLGSEVKEWLIHAAGRADCVDQLIGFIRVLTAEEQMRTGLPWVTKLVLGHPDRIARESWDLPDWLIEIRSIAVDVDLLNVWQEVVDALVVAGNRRLAPYSE